MAIDSFIPTVWSETLLNELDREYIAVKNCTREFEGDIKHKGDMVSISSIGAINVFNYNKNTDMTAPQTLDSESTQLEISQSMAFNFQIDDIDRAQQTPKIMRAAMREAAEALADKADKFVYGLYTDVPASNTVTQASLTEADVSNMIIGARMMLYKNNVNNNEGTVLEVSPEIGALIIKAKMLDSSDNTGIITNGYIGSYIGFDIYISNNIVRDSSGYYKCFARTGRAIAFAEQLNSIEAYRPEKRFADAIKGLHLYGASLVRPDELILLNLKAGTSE